MTSLGEVQRIIGLSLNKIQMGRNQRGGLPLHKNLLVATVLNKARDVYMQETMYMNYRLMTCGQFTPTTEEMEDEDTPEVEDYEEDSESDVEDEVDTTTTAKKEYINQVVINSCMNQAGLLASSNPSLLQQTTACELEQSPSSPSPADPADSQEENLTVSSTSSSSSSSSTTSTETNVSSSQQAYNSSDEGFIDESDCDCDTRNFCQDSENRVPFQYCYSCAPFHPSNGRGPTLVGPQTTSGCVLPQSPSHEQEDKLIYDMDSKSTRNQPGYMLKRKRHISVEETQDAICSILPKKLKEDVEGDEGEEEEESLNDSGYQEETQFFHPAFRGHNPNGMEVEQITSLVSIFSFGQQLFNSGCLDRSAVTPPQVFNSPINHDDGQNKKVSSSSKDPDDDSDSDSDTSSDSGHSSDDQNNSDEKTEDTSEDITHQSLKKSDLRCSAKLSENLLDSPATVPTAV